MLSQPCAPIVSVKTAFARKDPNPIREEASAAGEVWLAAVQDSSAAMVSEDKGKTATVNSVPMAKDLEGAGSEASRPDGRDCRDCSDLGSRIG